MNGVISRILISASAILLSFPITSLAGNWQPIGNEWKYQKDDGSYVSDSWLSEQGISYYFNKDGWMLKNTLSPDGLPLGRDGKLLSDTEPLPDTFSGTEAEYTTQLHAFVEFLDGYNKPFNQAYDEIYPFVLRVGTNLEYTSALASTDRLDSFDFSSYMASEYIGIRKAALYNEIFRIEQTYYLTEIIKASEQQNTQYYIELCDKMMISVNAYADRYKSLLNQISQWDRFD